MAKTHKQFVDEDFLRVIDFFKAGHILPASPPADLLVAAKSIHCHVYSLMLWQFRLPATQSHYRVFVDEIGSDAIQVLPLLFSGYHKCAALVLRGMVENLLRHIYFFDHRIEFIRMNHEPKWYVSVEDLFKYVVAHPIFMQTEQQFDAISRCKGLYDDLSAHVHGRKVTNLEQRRALKSIKRDPAKLDIFAKLVVRCAIAINFSLAAFHYEKFRGFPTLDRSLILRLLPPQARTAFRLFPIDYEV